MIAEFKLPDLGEGLTESEIVSWQVMVGDTVTLNQVLGEVETAKAVVELPSPYAGVVTAITHEPGTMVEVGEVIIAFEVAAQPILGSSTAPAKVAATGGTTEASSEGEHAPKRVPTLVGYGADPETSARPTRRARVMANADGPANSGASAPGSTPARSSALATSGPPTSEQSAQSAGTSNGRMQADRPRSTPPVRKLARDLGVVLDDVIGSGPQGLIVRDDVLAHAATPTGNSHSGHGSSAQPQRAGGERSGTGVSASTMGQSGEREVRTPIKGVQKFMAQAMVQSAFTAPHVTEFLTVDVTRGMKFLAKLRQRRDFEGVKLTPLTLAAKAVARGVVRQPTLNSHWDEKNQEIVVRNYLNLGIAAATPRGLVVPNIKDAHMLGLRELAVALGTLADTARAGKASPADLSGGTFSITNIGVFGIDAGTPILNPGEAGILALGAVRSTPWEHKGRIALRQVMTLSLSFDHRLVDGAAGSRFLAEVGAVLADPAMMLALD